MRWSNNFSGAALRLSGLPARRLLLTRSPVESAAPPEKSCRSSAQHGFLSPQAAPMRSNVRTTGSPDGNWTCSPAKRSASQRKQILQQDQQNMTSPAQSPRLKVSPVCPPVPRLAFRADQHQRDKRCAQTVNAEQQRRIAPERSHGDQRLLRRILPINRLPSPSSRA